MSKQKKQTQAVTTSQSVSEGKKVTPHERDQARQRAKKLKSERRTALGKPQRGDARRAARTVSENIAV